MKRSIIIFALILVVATSAAASIYLPIVLNGDCPEGAGIAWKHSGGTDDMKKLCASKFYNYQATLTVDEYRVPIVWCDYDDRSGFNNLETIHDLPPYPGPVLALNEPDVENQCNRTPTEVAVIWYAIESARPDIQTVGPNYSQFGIDELGEFVDEYERLYGKKPKPYRWAIHHYSFPGSTTYTETMNHLCSVLASRDYECMNIWVTEYGSTDPDMMRVLARQISNDPRVERFFLFTNRGPWEDLNAFYNGTDVLTPIGEAYLEGLISNGQ